MTEYDSSDHDKEDPSSGLNLIYEGEIPKCPACHLQEIAFLGNETGDEWVKGKSWFKCLIDGTVFSTRPKVLPRYRFISKR